MAACCRMTNLLHPSFVLLVFYHLLDSFNDKQTNSDVHLLMELVVCPNIILIVCCSYRFSRDQEENKQKTCYVFCRANGSSS